MSAIDVRQGATAVDEIHRIDRGSACIEEKRARGGGAHARRVAT